MASRRASSEYHIIMLYIILVGTYYTYIIWLVVTPCINILFVLFSRTESDLLEKLIKCYIYLRFLSLDRVQLRYPVSVYLTVR